MFAGNWMRLPIRHRNNSRMPDDAHYKLFFVGGIILFTLVTCWTDLRTRKIYNWTTLPMWILGWVYQATFFQWEGIFSGATGFAIGFGMFFLLWSMKIAGGGDVKLMGALGVWLGGPLTLKVIIASLIFVTVGMAALLVVRWLNKAKPILQSSSQSAPTETQTAGPAQKNQARLMAFAPPVALGTWSVLLLFQGQW